MPYYINNQPWERWGVPDLMEVFHCPYPISIVEGDKPAQGYDTRAEAVAGACEWYALEIKASEIRAAEFRKMLDGELAYQARVEAWQESLRAEEEGR